MFIKQSQIDGTVEEINENTIFHLIDGTTYKVRDYIYLYYYLYMPMVEVKNDRTMKIDGIDEEIPVEKININKKIIKGQFSGFTHQAIFEMTDGTKYQQIERYNYRYNYFMPEVAITDDGKMSVEGVPYAVNVQRIK